MSEPTQTQPREQSGRPQRSYAAAMLRDVFSRWGARLGLAWVAVMTLCAVFAPFLANSFPLLLSTEEGVSSPLLRALGPADVVLPIVLFAGIILLGFVRGVPYPSRFAALLWVTAAVIPFATWGMISNRDNWNRWAEALGGEPRLYALLAVAGLISLAFVVLVPLLSSASWRFKLSVGVALLPVLLLLLWVPPNPPAGAVYDQFRQMEARGEIDWAIYAPIPYSPSDRLRDRARDPETNERMHRTLLAPWWGPAIREAMGAELSERDQAARQRDHWLGTEEKGADVLSRMIHASRIAMAVGFIATGIALAIGVTIGGLMGYFSRMVDLLGMRLVEVFEAIPILFLLLAFVAFFGSNFYFIMVIIGLTSWVGFARFTRAEFLKLRKQDFVQAAIACGIPLHSILFRHMLPNGVAPVLVATSFGVASAILYESTLSFIGLGLVDEPSWGQMLSNATGPAGAFSWWMAMFPGLAIFLTVFAYTLIGEALRDAIDPHLKRATHL